MDISPKQFMEAIEQIAFDRKIPKERILETVEAAIAAAYRKDYGHPEQQVRAKLNTETGATELSVVHDIVAKKDDLENEHTQITVTEAKKKDKSAKTGGELVEKVKPPGDFGRIAAQTAKQVIIQRIREVEREIVQEEFSGRTGELMTGAVQRIEGRNVFVEIGRALGVLGPGDQIERERYYIGQRLRVLLKEVDQEGRGAQLILTRSHPDFVRHLFELEVPEIHAGTVEIRSVAREAGVRSKVAVHSNQEGVDPVGTCVGQRGTRVQAIMAELGDEKIDIVLFDEEPKAYIMNGLSPAKISRIDLNEKTKTANIIVADDQLSLAIGRGGQNVRLAGELTGWQLDIEKTEQQKKAGEAVAEDQNTSTAETVVSSIPLKEVEGVTEEEAKAFEAAKLTTAQQVAAADDEDLAKIEGADDGRIKEIQQAAATAVSESSEPPAEEAEAKLKQEGDETEAAAKSDGETPPKGTPAPPAEDVPVVKSEESGKAAAEDTVPEESGDKPVPKEEDAKPQVGAEEAPNQADSEQK